MASVCNKHGHISNEFPKIAARYRARNDGEIAYRARKESNILHSQAS